MSDLVAKRWPELDVVEDFAVERDPKGSILVRHGLTAAGEIENAQPCVGQAGTRLDVHAAVVRPAVIQHGDHAGQIICVDVGSRRHDSRNAAHFREMQSKGLANGRRSECT